MYDKYKLMHHEQQSTRSDGRWIIGLTQTGPHMVVIVVAPDGHGIGQVVGIASVS